MHLLFLLTASLHLFLCFRTSTSFRPQSTLKINYMFWIENLKRYSIIYWTYISWTYNHWNNLRKWEWVKKSLFFSKFSWGVEQWRTNTLLVGMVDLVISLYGLILVLIGLFEENKQSFVALSNSNISHAVPSMQCLHMSNYILYERKQYIMSISNFKIKSTYHHYNWLLYLPGTLLYTVYNKNTWFESEYYVVKSNIRTFIFSF